MLPYLNNAQCEKLQEVLQHTLAKYEVTEKKQQENNSEQNYVELFLSAKRIEGCSEKTLKYYKATIQAMIDSIGKGIKYIVTDDIRCYLTEYQSNKNSGNKNASGKNTTNRNAKNAYESDRNAYDSSKSCHNESDKY
ncbi:MAG: hypothetical protein EGR13_04850 [Coprococcus comes]|nr:hypothetical protein [Coprococcus comes]